MVLKVIFIAVIIIIIRLLINTIRYFQVQKYLDLYLTWLSDLNWEFIEHKQTVIDLWEKANISDSFVPRASPIGMGQGVSYKKHLFFSFPTNESDLAHATVTAFHEAKGVYKKRIISTINPLEWISFIVFLPREILKYFHVESKNIFVKITQVVWWLICALTSGVIAIYPDEIKTLINNLLQK